MEKSPFKFDLKVAFTVTATVAAMLTMLRFLPLLASIPLKWQAICAGLYWGALAAPVSLCIWFIKRRRPPC